MNNDDGPMRPDRDGLISAPPVNNNAGSGVRSPFATTATTAATAGGFPSLSPAEVDLFEWDGSDILAEEAEAPLAGKTEKSSGKATSGQEEHSTRVDPVRKVSGWSMTVSNKRADLAALLSVVSYRFGMLTVAVVLMFKACFFFGVLPDIPDSGKALLLGVCLLVTLLCGFIALGLTLTKSVALRGERFVKRVVQLSLYAMLFMNSLLFVLLYSVFEWPDFSLIFG